MPNNSMDVRAKQRLSYHVVFLTQTGFLAVSPHVILAVRPFPLYASKMNFQGKL
jgi:hypothetical protein